MLIEEDDDEIEEDDDDWPRGRRSLPAGRAIPAFYDHACPISGIEIWKANKRRKQGVF